MDEVDTILHKAADGLYALHRSVSAIVGHYRCKDFCNLSRCFFEDILMIEPYTLLIVELGTSLRAS